MTSKINRLKCVCSGCLVLLLAASLQNANAYSYRVKKSTNSKVAWHSSQVNWSAGAKSFPPDSPFRTNLILTNFWWNRTPANFKFGMAKWGDTKLRRGNGQSEIWFSKDKDAHRGAPAICYTWLYFFDGRFWFKEADIIFNADTLWAWHPWQYELVPYGGDYRPFTTTAIHEMGHALGLGHENKWYNVMGQDYTHVNTNNNIAKAYVGADATQGALFIYGKANAVLTEDVAVTHWKYGGASGEYSVHTQTMMYHQNMTVVGWDWYNGSPRFHVRRGDTYHAEFTFENNGYSAQSNVNLASYVSTNTVITTTDRLIGEYHIPDLPAGAVFTLTVPLVIPADLIEGMTYFLGVVIDHRDTIREFNETNNAAYQQIKIVP